MSDDKITLANILSLIDRLMAIEQIIEIKIGQLKDVHKRKEVRELYKNRDSDKFRKLFFDDK